MNINPFINLIAGALSIYSFLLVIYIILYYLFMFRVVNPYNIFVMRLNRFLIEIIEPVLGKIRKYIPVVAGVDLALIVLFLLIHFTKDVLYTYFYVY